MKSQSIRVTASSMISSDAGARPSANHLKPKVVTFCAAFWLTFALPLTAVGMRWHKVYGYRLRVNDLFFWPRKRLRLDRL